MAQQTAVTWLLKSMHRVDKMDWDILFMRAVEMEKMQIKMAYNDGADHMVESKYEGMDNYYKLRYGSHNQI